MKIEVIAIKKGYKVTKKGILCNPKGQEIGKYVNNCGYYTTSIKIEGKKYDLTVHRLQAYQKFGKKLFKDGIVVRHLDGDKLNNYWSNISIGTGKDNSLDIPKSIRVERSSNPKYNHSQIIEDRKNGMTYSEIMRKHNILSKGTVSFIINKSLQNEK